MLDFSFHPDFPKVQFPFSLWIKIWKFWWKLLHIFGKWIWIISNFPHNQREPMWHFDIQKNLHELSKLIANQSKLQFKQSPSATLLTNHTRFPNKDSQHDLSELQIFLIKVSKIWNSPLTQTKMLISWTKSWVKSSQRCTHA